MSRSALPVAAFVAVYALFSVYPTFLTEPAMRFARTVPAFDSIGVDLRQMLGYSRAWLDGASPYIGNNLYPPFATVAFAPLTALGAGTAFALITGLTTIAFLFAAWLVPLQLSSRHDVRWPLALVVAGLTSYGLQFELERGQFNVMAMAFATAGVWVFHARPRHRWAAYLLVTIAAQLKVYPFIFVLLLIDDWRDIRRMAQRLGALAAVNLAACFILGPSTFTQFITAITAQTNEPLVWAGNHSIRSYVATVLHPASPKIYELMFLSLVAMCLLVTIWRAHQLNRGGVDRCLWLACTLTALVLPPVSHDYKLPLLAGPIALLLMTPTDDGFVSIVLTSALSGAYALTLFSYADKPGVLDNNFPVLLLMLVVTAALSMLPRSPGRVELRNG